MYLILLVLDLHSIYQLFHKEILLPFREQILCKNQIVGLFTPFRNRTAKFSVVVSQVGRGVVEWKLAEVRDHGGLSLCT